MNLKFWKKKAALEADAAPSAPGLFAKIKAQVAALGGRFKRKPKFQAEVAAETSGAVGALPPQQESSDRPGLFARIKFAVTNLTYNQVLIGGVVLLLMMLMAVGYAAWTIIQTAPDKNANIAELVDKSPPHTPPATLPGSAPEAISAVIEASAVEAASSVEAASAAIAASAPAIALVASAVPLTSTHMAHATSAITATLPIAAMVAPASHPPQSELEALKQKNAELQKQIDELKKAQRLSSARVRLYPPDKKALPGGQAIVGTSAPKAAAETLKETIEKMNSGGGIYRK